MIQLEFFKKTQTDMLLSMRYKQTCYFPQNESDKPDYDNDQGKMWFINKELLFAELSTREHRIRAKDRRKSK